MDGPAGEAHPEPLGLEEYRKHAVDWVSADQSDRQWLIWIKRRFGKAVVAELRAGCAVISQRLK